LILSGLHDVIPQKTELFIIDALRDTSYEHIGLTTRARTLEGRPMRVDLDKRHAVANLVEALC
jgi:hypothetical protein